MFILNNIAGLETGQESITSKIKKLAPIDNPVFTNAVALNNAGLTFNTKVNPTTSYSSAIYPNNNSLLFDMESANSFEFIGPSPAGKTIATLN